MERGARAQGFRSTQRTPRSRVAQPADPLAAACITDQEQMHPDDAKLEVETAAWMGAPSLDSDPHSAGATSTRTPFRTNHQLEKDQTNRDFHPSVTF